MATIGRPAALGSDEGHDGRGVDARLLARVAALDRDHQQVQRESFGSGFGEQGRAKRRRAKSGRPGSLGTVGWVKDCASTWAALGKCSRTMSRTLRWSSRPRGTGEGAAKFTTPGAVVSTADLDKLQAAYNLYLGAVRPSRRASAALDESMRKASVDGRRRPTGQDLERRLNAMEVSANEAMQQRPLGAGLEGGEALKTTEEAAKKAKESTDGDRPAPRVPGRPCPGLADQHEQPGRPDSRDGQRHVGRGESLADRRKFRHRRR